MRRRPRPPQPPPDGLADAQAAALERAAVPPGFRMDGPEFAHNQAAVDRILAARWRRRQARPFQGSATRRYVGWGQVETLL